jgi:hypothetical protein
MQPFTQPLADARAASVLERLHRAANAQAFGIALRFVSQLPSFAFGKGIELLATHQHWP